MTCNIYKSLDKKVLYKVEYLKKKHYFCTQIKQYK